MNDETNWEDLVDRHLRGELEEAEMERLAEELNRDLNVRHQFVQQASWDTELTEAIRETNGLNMDQIPPELTGSKTERVWASKPSTLQPLLAAAAVIIIALSIGLINQLTTPRTASVQNSRGVKDAEPSIATITGLSGAMIWTGDRGQTVQDITVGTELSGGTIEGLGPDSWFELKFHDGSTVMISGISLLTFADADQKKLRLREGRLSAKVSPQPDGKPMLIQTRNAFMEVLGTQFDLETDLASTELTVNEGKVNFKRLSDGSEVNVLAKHHVTTDTDEVLAPSLKPDSVHAWKSELRTNLGYGKWQPATEETPASLRAIPLIPPTSPNSTLYLSSLSVSRSDASPVVLLQKSKIIVRGQLSYATRVHFGIRVKYANGEFAGMYRGDLLAKQPLAMVEDSGKFEEVYSLEHFTIDPSVSERRQQKLAPKPDGLILDAIWAFTANGRPAGLAISEVEVVPPDQWDNIKGKRSRSLSEQSR